MHHLLNRRAGLGALVTGALLASLALAPAAPAATIKACQKKKGGALRIITGKAKCKKKTEKTLSWSTTGPAGKNGANGTNGSNGAAGTNGANGANGAAGQPQSVTFIDFTRDTSLTKSTIFTGSGISLKLNCVFFIANIGDIQVNGPSGQGSFQAGYTVADADGNAPGIAQSGFAQRGTFSGADQSLASITSNTSGQFTNVAHVTGSIKTASDFLLLDLLLKVGPSPTACQVRGGVLAIPTS